MLWSSLNVVVMTILFMYMVNKAKCAETRKLALVPLATAAVELLARRGGGREYGARPLRRAISTLVEDPAADLMLEGRLKKGDTLKVSARDGAVQVEPA